MEATDVIDVLKACAAYDQRTVGDADVIAWTVALPELITKPAAMEAVIEHYRESPMPMRVADLIRIVKSARKARLDAAGPPDLPSGLDQVREREYARAWRQAIAHGMSREEATSHVDGLGGIVRTELAPADPARMRALAAGAFR